MLLTLSLFVHLIATVTWLGGLLLLIGVVLPGTRSALAKTEDQGLVLLRLMDHWRQRLTPLTNLSLIALTVTGVIQMAENPAYEGLLQFNNRWSQAMLMKHVAFAAVVAISVILQFAVTPALDRASRLARHGKDSPELARLQTQENRLSAISLWLGVVILFLTAIMTAV
jgi:uncharacterized membrane protein